MMKRTKNNIYKDLSRATTIVSLLFFSLLLIGSAVIYLFIVYQPETKNDRVFESEKKDQSADLKIDHDFILSEGVEVVIANCTGCHSSKLVTQNRATREGWRSMIVWMQETQNLWDLGNNEKVILDYLERNYSPKYIGRRQQITNIDWYVLND